MSTASLELRTPLRWAGSKRQLIPEIRLASPSEFKRYIEPFAGSACVFFALKPGSAVLNDINADLLNFYKALRSHPRRVARLALSMPTTEAYYYELRSTPVIQMSPLERAARFLYLNRFCFNGVYRTNRKGTFNVPRGHSTGGMPTEGELLNCSLLLRKAKLVTGDFHEVMVKVSSDDFIYLDPPYATVERKTYGEYGYGTYSEADRPRLVDSLLEADARGAKIVLSYRNDLALVSSLSGWYYKNISVRRHVAGFAKSRGLFAEVLMTNFPLVGASGRVQ